MKLWILVVTLLLCLQLVTSKTIEKISRKKSSVTKKKIMKASKSDPFHDLPPEDIEFIKELDKQFKLHGDNIKFKIERINTTTTGKNSKRTIDGELGYGYHSHQHSSGYQFSQPKYVIYPYSQHDIPALASEPVGSYQKTIVTIQPSQAYELKETNVGYEHQNQYIPQEVQHTGYMHYQPVTYYAEPVIVLRIPGPSKYASHLQALLQQYLEIRATEYLKALQQSESQYQHGDSYQQQYQEGMNDGHREAQVLYRPIEQVYQTYQYLHRQKPQAQPQPQVQEYNVYEGGHEEGGAGHGGDDHGNSYDYSSQEGHSNANSYSHESSYHYRTPIYEYSTHHETAEPHTVYGPASHDSYSEDHGLPISENYPSNRHTKVVFTDRNNKDHSTSYPLPSVGKSSNYQTAHQEYDYVDANYHGQESTLSITQKPYNYHTTHVASKGLKRDASASEEQRLKINKVTIRLKKKTQGGDAH